MRKSEGGTEDELRNTSGFEGFRSQSTEFSGESGTSCGKKPSPTGAGISFLVVETGEEQ